MISPPCCLGMDSGWGLSGTRYYVINATFYFEQCCSHPVWWALLSNTDTDTETWGLSIIHLKLQRPCLDPTEPCNSSADLVTGAKALELRRLALEKGFGFIAVTITALHLMAPECIFSHYKYTLNCREANFPLFSQGFRLGLIIKLT